MINYREEIELKPGKGKKYKINPERNNLIEEKSKLLPGVSVSPDGYTKPLPKEADIMITRKLSENSLKKVKFGERNKKRQYLYTNQTLPVSKQFVKHIAGFEFRVTDGYGVRTSAVPGRAGQDSGGIDIVYKDDMIHSLTDGKVIAVGLQGNGKTMKTTQGQSAGYYFKVKVPDGTIITYMHADPMTKEEMKALKGKQVKAGEILASNKVGSGSQTARHTKVRVNVGKGKKFNIDPTMHLLGKSYGDYIQDILKY